MAEDVFFAFSGAFVGAVAAIVFLAILLALVDKKAKDASPVFLQLTLLFFMVWGASYALVYWR